MATVIGIFEDQYKKDKPLTVVRPGTQMRRFTHIQDTIDVCYEAWLKNKCAHYSILNKKSVRGLRVQLPQLLCQPPVPPPALAFVLRALQKAATAASPRWRVLRHRRWGSARSPEVKVPAASASTKKRGFFFWWPQWPQSAPPALPARSLSSGRFCSSRQVPARQCGSSSSLSSLIFSFGSPGPPSRCTARRAPLFGFNPLASHSCVRSSLLAG